jgi:hypothetical protein
VLNILLVLIVVLLRQIQSELQRSNRHFANEDPRIDFFRPGQSRMPSVVTWVSRGAVFAVITALMWCALYLNRLAIGDCMNDCMAAASGYFAKRA